MYSNSYYYEFVGSRNILEYNSCLASQSERKAANLEESQYFFFFFFFGSKVFIEASRYIMFFQPSTSTSGASTIILFLFLQQNIF